MREVFNFANSAFNHAKNGFKTVTDEIKNSRLDICKSCNKLKNDKCSECGCFVNIKASWDSEKCPLEKW